MEENVSNTLPPQRSKTMVNLREAAAICGVEGLGLTYRVLRGLVLTGRIAALKSGNRSYINMDVLREMIKNQNSALYQN